MARRQIGDRYTLTQKILTGDPTRGIPELWRAADAGDTYYVKLWKRSGHDGDIRTLWNREVRSLMRLQGYPGASEFFVRLHDLHAGDEHFYAVLDGGERLLLANVLEARSQFSWLQNLAEVGRRRPLWDGLLRIAEGLSILHSEGTLHRDLSPAAIFTAPDGRGEFRLSGFEWSVRIASRDTDARTVGRRTGLIAPELENGDGEYSTATDWFDFGLVAAQIFGISIRSFRKREAVRSAVSRLSHLRDAERSTILQLLADNRDDRLAGAKIVTQALRDIVRDLSSVTATAGRHLMLAVRLGEHVPLARTVELASENKAKADQPLAQLRWIQHDLRGDLRVTARMLPSSHFILRGAKLEYRVRQWSVDGMSTWDIGFCDSVEAVPRTNVDDQHYNLGQRPLDIDTYPNVRRTQQTIRDRSAAWDRVFSFAQARAQIEPHLRDVHDFFRITQQLDTLLTVAQIWPVEVLEVDRTTTETEIQVTPWEEPERNILAQHLGLAPPSEQMRDWFHLGAEPVIADDEDDPDRDAYELLERRTVFSEGSPADWHFIAARPDAKGPKYIFRCEGNVAVGRGRAYLAKNHGGALAQIRRQHQAIEDLRSHEGLLRLFADPRGISRTVNEPLPTQRANIPLDKSKIDALGRLWRLQPSFAIQGPPGTGKTTLIEAFADRLFTADPGAQVLITGHSHHTVDHVRIKLHDLFLNSTESDRPILVRLGSKKPTNHDLAPVTLSLAERLRDSELLRRAPDYLQERIHALMHPSDTRSEDADVDFRTMQQLVQDASNLTFATSNSAELADLAERGRRFDWSVIEEAGKAHGFDMAVALQESHRLLLIGDHFQLPPYNARLFKTLLGDPLRVTKAIQTGAQFAPGLVDASLVDEDEGRAPFGDRCQTWRQMVTLFAVLFQRSLGNEGDEPGPAATLTDQHRMHPDIADLVGRIFYPKEGGGTILNSPPETFARFAKEPPFATASGSWLPNQRIVWCNVPWVQKNEFAEGETEGLFVSPPEIKVVIAVLEQFLPRAEEACEIQILSPYNDQLKAIRDGIERARKQGRLGSMFQPPFDLRKNKRLGATVDEFQGDEADIVIVSLVRNNALVPWASVGFLKEANRMDVLLSRARHKLVIVGSWQFWQSRCDQYTPRDAEHAYIGRMMSHIGDAVKAGRATRVEFSK